MRRLAGWLALIAGIIAFSVVMAYGMDTLLQQIVDILNAVNRPAGDTTH